MKGFCISPNVREWPTMTRPSNILLFFLATLVYAITFAITWSTFSNVTFNNPHPSYVYSREEMIDKADAPNNSTYTLLTLDLGDNKGCTFPRVDPFDKAVMKYIFEFPTLKCHDNVTKPSLVYLYKDIWLRVDKRKAMRMSIRYDYCQYSQLKMEEGSDYELQPYKWSERFSEIIHIDDGDEYMYVMCYYKGRIVSRSFVSRFIKKPEIENRAKTDYQNHLKTNTPSETLNILMIGIDGMSKQAFERSMPKTRNFLLNDFKAKELHKFNKVGQNTFPNVIPLLTGKHEEEILQNWTYDDHFDKIDHLFIWNEFKKAGYRTAFMTDVVWLTAFHYMKQGWVRPPFDYFFRAIPAKAYHDKQNGKMDEHCIGDKPEISVCLNYWLQLTSALNTTIHKNYKRPASPYFAYSFLTRLSHDYASLSNQGDDLYLSFFQEIKQRNTLHNTVMVVFSDHGGRFGKVRAMYQGMLESRMPFVMVIFPQWFQEKYPKVMATFTENQNRLTTMFDIHATLQDLMTFSRHPDSDSDDIESDTSKKQRGISLLRKIPISRNCKDAGIPVKYCLCSRLHHSKIPETTSTILVYTLYEYLQEITIEYRDICHELKLKSIVSIFPMESESSEKTKSFYQITIETIPGDAVFEATISYDSDGYMGQIEGDVVRLNMYKGQDECMKKLHLKSFCFCRKKLEKVSQEEE